MAEIQHRWELNIQEALGALRSMTAEMKQALDQADELGQTLDDGLNQAAQSASDAGDDVEDLGEDAKKAGAEGSGAMGAFKGALAGVGVAAGAAAAAVAAVVTGAIKLSDDLNLVTKRAHAVGTSVEDFQRLQGAMDLLTDGSAKAETALLQLNRQLDEARTGAGPAADQLDRMGLSADELISMDAVTRFKAVAEGISGLGDRAAQTAAAADLLGRAGRSMVDVFANGVAPINDAIEAVNQAGIFSEATALEAELLADAVYLAQQSFGTLSRSLLKETMPVVRELTDDVAEFLQEFAKSEEAERLARELGDTLESLRPTLFAILEIVKDLDWAFAAAAETLSLMSDGVDVLVGMAWGLELVSDEAADAAWEVGKFSAESRAAEAAARSAATATKEWGELLDFYTAAAARATAEGVESEMDRADAVVASRKRQIAAEREAVVERILALKVGKDGTVKTAEEQTEILAAFARWEIEQLRQAKAEAARIRADDAEREKQAEERKRQGAEQAAKIRAKGREEGVDAEEEAAREVSESWDNAYMAIGEDQVNYVEDERAVRERHHIEWLRENRAFHKERKEDDKESLQDSISMALSAAAEYEGIVGTMSNVAAGIATNVAAIISSVAGEGSEAAKEAARTQVAVTAAAAIAQSVMHFVVAAGHWASSESDWKSGLAAAAIATGEAIAAVAIVAQAESDFSSKFHRGGVVSLDPGARQVDEVPATLLAGEGVLSRRAVQDLGGKAAVNDMNQGQSTPRQFLVVNQVGLGTFDALVHEDNRRQGTLYRRIRSAPRHALGRVDPWRY